MTQVVDRHVDCFGVSSMAQEGEREFWMGRQTGHV